MIGRQRDCFPVTRVSNPLAVGSSKHNARLAKWRSGRRVSGPLQRDPDSEEPEAPLVEPGVPHGCFLVAPVVDWATSPLPPGRRERSAPIWVRRLTRSPRCGSVSPRGLVEVATVRIPVPWTGSARATGSAWGWSAWATGSPRAARVTGTALATGSALVIWTVLATGPARARSTGARPAWITGCVRGMEASGPA